MRPNWFLGLPVVAGSWFDELTAELPPGIRRFHPLDLHLTVAFLGGCGEAPAHAAWEALAPLRHEPCVARTGPLRAMGNPRRPSAYSLTLAAGRDEVAALIGAWREPAHRASETRPDERAPLPHLTVARPPRRADSTLRRAGVAWLRAAVVPDVELTIDRVALYTWAEDRRTRQFRIVVERPLEGRISRMSTVFYFAYGSNADPDRFRDRVGEWSSRRRGTLYDYRLRFADSVQSEGGGGAVIDARRGERVEGVLFEITGEQLEAMDRVEFDPSRDTADLGRRFRVTVETDDGPIPAEVYSIQDDGEGSRAPSDRYLGHILRGLRAAGHPEEVLDGVRDVAAES